MKSRSILYALIALIVLVGLILVIRPNNKQASPSNGPTTKEYSFVLKDRQRVSGPDKMDVSEGDQVKITLSSDADWPELHLHGYEIAKPITKDQPTVISFTANKTGNYALEIHFVEESGTDTNSDGADTSVGSGNELQISHLEVQPK